MRDRGQRREGVEGAVLDPPQHPGVRRAGDGRRAVEEPPRAPMGHDHAADGRVRAAAVQAQVRLAAPRGVHGRGVAARVDAAAAHLLRGDGVDVARQAKVQREKIPRLARVLEVQDRPRHDGGRVRREVRVVLEHERVGDAALDDVAPGRQVAQEDADLALAEHGALRDGLHEDVRRQGDAVGAGDPRRGVEQPRGGELAPREVPPVRRAPEVEHEGRQLPTRRHASRDGLEGREAPRRRPVSRGRGDVRRARVPRERRRRREGGALRLARAAADVQLVRDGAGDGRRDGRVERHGFRHAVDERPRRGPGVRVAAPLDEERPVVDEHGQRRAERRPRLGRVGLDDGLELAEQDLVAPPREYAPRLVAEGRERPEAEREQERAEAVVDAQGFKVGHEHGVAFDGGRHEDGRVAGGQP